MHTALSRRVAAGVALESVRAARHNDAFRNLGRWDRSNRVNCGRCRARRALVEGYDTRARPLPVPRGDCARRDKRNLWERARRVVSNFVEVLGLVSLVRVVVFEVCRTSFCQLSNTCSACYSYPCLVCRPTSVHDEHRHSIPTPPLKRLASVLQKKPGLLHRCARGDSPGVCLRLRQPVGKKVRAVGTPSRCRRRLSWYGRRQHLERSPPSPGRRRSRARSPGRGCQILLPTSRSRELKKIAFEASDVANNICGALSPAA